MGIIFERKNLYSLLLEAILIVAGVLVSLFFQGKFDDLQKREEGTQILKQVSSDLQLDTAMFSANIRKIDYLMSRYAHLLGRGPEKISDQEMPDIVKGILATDTEVITFMNKGGYLRFTSFGNYELYQQPTLINHILHYYNNRNELILNMSEWDTKFVETNVVEYYLTHHTGNLKNYFEQRVLHAPPHENSTTIMKRMLDDSYFQSLVIFNYINKENYRDELVSARDEAVTLLKELQPGIR